tara:strand:+ start:280 stop:702 length:423 start_codon:yes stop_codon:yes gene_type:complete
MSIEKIYSKLETDKLLHIIHRIEHAVDTPRNDLIESNNFIQCSFLKLKKDSTFKPHKHIFKKRKYENQIAQESWVIIRGKVKCIFYDLDDSIIAERILYQGDASFTLLGGHNYVSLEDDTIVYEYKTGPYEGQEHDKQFI